MASSGHPRSSPQRVERLALDCAAGVALAVAATWLRFGWERTLRLETGTLPFLASALLVGIGLAVAGAGALRLERLDGPVTGAQLRWALGAQVIALPAIALTSLDVYSNVAYGQLQRIGHNPYLEGPRGLGDSPLLALVAPRWAEMPSAYGPVVSLTSRVAAAAGEALGSQVWAGAAAFKLAMVACGAGTILLAYALLRGGDEPDAAGRFALLAFSPVLAWEISAQAHNDGLLVLALTAFVWAAWSGREAAAVLALAAAALSKAPAAPLLVVYLAFVARRSWRRALLLAAAAGALAAALLAPYWRGLATFRGSGAALGGEVARHAHSLADLLAMVLGPLSASGAAAAYWACWLASLALCGFLVVRAAWRATSAEQVIHDGLALFLAYSLTTPWFQPWYATWLLPLALVERSTALRRVVAWYAVLTVVQWGLPLDPFSTVAVNAWIAMSWWRATRDSGQGSAQDAWRRTGAAPVI